MRVADATISHMHSKTYILFISTYHSFYSWGKSWSFCIKCVILFLTKQFIWWGEKDFPRLRVGCKYLSQSYVLFLGICAREGANLSVYLMELRCKSSQSVFHFKVPFRLGVFLEEKATKGVNNRRNYFIFAISISSVCFWEMRVFFSELHHWFVAATATKIVFYTAKTESGEKENIAVTPASLSIPPLQQV